MLPKNDGSWGNVNWNEVLTTMGGAGVIGAIRMLYLVRKGRTFHFLDAVLEPCLALLASMMVWAVTEYMNVPDMLQAMLCSVGAWGGPKTIRHFELKYFGGTRAEDPGLHFDFSQTYTGPERRKQPRGDPNES